MRGERTEKAIVVLVMAAAGLILIAPLLGRSGSPGWADVAMGLASGAGLGAFVLVAVLLTWYSFWRIRRSSIPKRATVG